METGERVLIYEREQVLTSHPLEGTGCLLPYLVIPFLQRRNSIRCDPSHRFPLSFCDIPGGRQLTYTHTYSLFPPLSHSQRSLPSTHQRYWPGFPDPALSYFSQSARSDPRSKLLIPAYTCYKRQKTAYACTRTDYYFLTFSMLNFFYIFCRTLP